MVAFANLLENGLIGMSFSIVTIGLYLTQIVQPQTVAECVVCWMVVLPTCVAALWVQSKLQKEECRGAECAPLRRVDSAEALCAHWHPASSSSPSAQHRSTGPWPSHVSPRTQGSRGQHQPISPAGRASQDVDASCSSSSRTQLPAMFDSASSAVEGEKVLSEFVGTPGQAAAPDQAAAAAGASPAAPATHGGIAAPESSAAAAATAAEGMTCALSSIVGLPDVLPGLTSLLGPKQAAAAFLAAAAAAAASTCSGASPRGRAAGAAMHYKSLAQSMPLCIKVHSAPHASLPALAPLLAGAASCHLAAAGAAAAAGCPVYLQSAAFLGCVQLLASVFSLKPDAGQADAGSYGSSSSIAAPPQPVQACSNKPRTDELAARLLDAACFAAAGAAGVIAGRAAPAVDVVVGSSVASRRPPPADAEAAPGDQPAAGQDTSSNAAAVQAAAALELLYCQPGCIAAGRERQQLELTVSLGNSGASSLPCRLLVLQGGAVVAEVPEVVLRQSARQASTSIRVALPIMAAGVAQVALLPAAAAAASGGGTAAPPSAAVPLLLQPLLVLPEAAATELEAFFQSHAAEAAVAALTSGQDSARAIAAAAAAAWSVQSSLTVDLAYAMSAADDLSSDSKAAAAIAVASSRSSGVSGQAGVLPAGVRAVLTHLLTHLASWHCWSTLEFVVQHLAAASAATAARAEAAAATPAGPAEAATGFSSSPSAAAAFAVAESDDVSDWTLADMAPAAAATMCAAVDVEDEPVGSLAAFLGLVAATEGGTAGAAGGGRQEAAAPASHAQCMMLAAQLPVM